jgi:serine acetyltransferase
MRLRHNVTVGALTLVNKDVLEESTVVGMPFRYAE